MLKRIAILGSTGSIGTQALEVIALHPDRLCVEALSAHNQWELLVKQALLFHPNCVTIVNETHYTKVKDALEPHGIKVFCGAESLNDIVQMDSVDVVLTALVGFSGLKPTLKAISAKKTIALANKETLVVAGELIRERVSQQRCALLPVDSEHAAIFQCLMGEGANGIERLFLTGSGGPFRCRPYPELAHVRPEEALKHPTWNMGAKISIDSATLMNKGLEVIEAHWLFDVPYSDIEVLIHPESIVHSMLCFEDGSVKAQLGLPDMKLPIQVALSYPERWSTPWPRCDFRALKQLHFEAPRIDDFRCLSLAFEAGQQGGNAPCILNAANEIAVDAFLKRQIGFLDIPKLIEDSLNHLERCAHPDLDTLIECDLQTRHYTLNRIQHLQPR